MDASVSKNFCWTSLVHTFSIPLFAFFPFTRSPLPQRKKLSRKEKEDMQLKRWEATRKVEMGWRLMQNTVIHHKQKKPQRRMNAEWQWVSKEAGPRGWSLSGGAGAEREHKRKWHGKVNVETPGVENLWHHSILHLSGLNGVRLCLLTSLCTFNRIYGGLEFIQIISFLLTR